MAESSTVTMGKRLCTGIVKVFQERADDDSRVTLGKWS